MRTTIRQSPSKQTFYATAGKRLFDALFSAAGIILLSPLLLIVAIAVRLTSRGPAIFQQTRTGQFEKPFRLLKFRSMKLTAPGEGSLLTAAGDSRITPLGRWLRKTKIDELPQLWNVLKGDMSLVGPRPEVPYFTAQYSETQKQVLATRPGITSPDIVIDEEELMAGRPDKEQFYLAEIMPAKLKIDLAYVENVRFFNDLAILLRTVSSLLLRVLHMARIAGTTSHVTSSSAASATKSNPD